MKASSFKASPSATNTDTSNNIGNNKKKRKSKSSNPLSDARRSSSNFYQDLWNKKSGLGFTLFVQYYGQQPKECCVGSDDNANNRIPGVAATSLASNTSLTSTTTGMSRAAKRRRKKKGTASVVEEEDNLPANATNQKDDDEEKTVDNPSLSTATISFPSFPSSSRSSSSASHRLLQELEQPHNSSYSHLLPFLQAMSRPLPLTFRLRNIRQYDNNEEALSKLKSLQEELQTSFHEFVQPASFGATIYQAHSSLQLHKNALSNTCPALKEFLVQASSEGLLARQEVGSMLPVLGLHRGKHLKRNARVLDLCASPGSKTLQALEIVGPRGRVVANDVHPKRLETLQDAVQRSGMPWLDRLVYTNHDAAVFPKTLPIGSTTSQQRPHVVLCDVPCSGDGTIRKDPTILPGWSPTAARALHELQCRILRRALEVVQVGGVVSYSTCSLNPMENEAVVQTVLRLVDLNDDEAVELLEWPEIEGLALRPGATSWKVLDYLQEASKDNEDNLAEGRWEEYTCYEEAKDVMVHCYPTLWPLHERQAKDALKRCRRLWPQDQDTGGFFVALLRKKAELPNSKRNSTNQNEKSR